MLFGKAKKEGTSKVTPSLGGKNGSTPRPATAAQEKKPVTRPRDARQARFAQSFAQIVAVLMRDPNFRNMRLADLQWLVLPPVMAGQFRLAQVPMPQDTKGQEAGKAPQGAKAQEGGILVPMAVALWARVSPDIDKGLSESLDKEVRLRPNQWASGNIVWLTAVAGDPRAKPRFLKQLAETEFKGQHVKMRLRGPDGKVVVRALDPAK
jgi:cytolysin-activating lysine-acyltransferase